MRWVRWRPGVGGGAWFSLNASYILSGNRSSFFLSGPPTGSEICSGVGGIDRGLQWAGEECRGLGGAPAPPGELSISPRLEVDTLSLCSPCLVSVLSLARLCDSLSEETVDEEEEVLDGLLAPDDRELLLLFSLCALRCSLRFSRSSFLCRVTSDDEVDFSPAVDALRVPSSPLPSLPSEDLCFLSGDWNIEVVEELGLSGTELAALPSMTSSWEALALSKASALDERGFLTGCGIGV